MAHLDTHVAVWLCQGSVDLLSPDCKRVLEQEESLVSPMVALELAFLYEIKRIRLTSAKILSILQKEIGLRVCDLSLQAISAQAINESWTRDPFDRIIVAHARAMKASLLSKDSVIRKNYSSAIW